MAKLLRLGKKRNEFLCFALDFFVTLSLCDELTEHSAKKINTFILFCSRFFVTLPSLWEKLLLQASDRGMGKT
jgi:hypothetical protein